MALEVTEPKVNAGDGIAGSELGRLEAWAVEYFEQSAKTFFKTVERWRGQFKAEALERHSFKAPALFITCLGSNGGAVTSGGMTYIDIQFAAAGIVAEGAGASVGEKKDRYQWAVALMGTVLSLLHQMAPPKTTDTDTNRLVPDVRYPWQRASSIGVSNKYSKKFDEKGFSFFQAEWVHRLELGNINMECLPDLVTLFGDIFPDGGTPPAQGEVTFS